MKAYIFSVTLTGLAYLALGPIGAFAVFVVCAFIVGVSTLGMQAIREGLVEKPKPR